ncbi:PREDICTED: uncharacterized protein LOC106337846 [Brassica oleracea var. oleracea]|uniref:uncharacterized protein LOC106337846 n=1 Tax=Brassica oleracea var. oleracea TaxID=109376 RepID=UPI0006A6F492|nr:PREDICTED: uncharacterized protein LOC106337846 [Brassica oleracea var. oleracea]
MAKVFFSDLKAGRCSSVVEARLLRYWEARNVKRGGELMWMDLLMVNVNSTVMQVTISAGRLPQFLEQLHAGTMFSVSGFDVSRCAQNFRLTDSSLMIRFNESTSFQELTEPVSPLPEEAFRFRNHSELIGLANTNTQLPDIIGEILSVKSTVCDPPEEKNRVMVTLKLDSDETVTLSFFDSQAVAFHIQLEAMRVNPKVMVVTSINPKIVGGVELCGRLFLNATSGTHVYFDKKTGAGAALFYRLAARDTGLPSAAPLLNSYAKVENMTIADLNSFIVSAASQEIDFLCTGRVVRIDTDKGWCYVACSKCSKKLQRTESAFTCGVCNNPQAVGALRYRVEMAISDDTAEGTFVWFDGVLTKLHSIRASEAAQMLAEDGVNPEDARLPPFIADMEGKTYTFQVRVTAFNFTEHHKTFTITRIAEDHGRLPVDDVVNNGDDDDDDGDDASPNIEPSSAAGDQGGTSKARKKTGAGSNLPLRLTPTPGHPGPPCYFWGGNDVAAAGLEGCLGPGLGPSVNRGEEKKTGAGASKVVKKARAG